MPFDTAPMDLPQFGFEQRRNRSRKLRFAGIDEFANGVGHATVPDDLRRADGLRITIEMRRRESGDLRPAAAPRRFYGVWPIRQAGGLKRCRKDGLNVRGVDGASTANASPGEYTMRQVDGQTLLVRCPSQTFGQTSSEMQAVGQDGRQMGCQVLIPVAVPMVGCHTVRPWRDARHNWSRAPGIASWRF
ncbi:MAG: hypothetical protein ABW003_27315 [Microvirga sp.]